MARDQNPEAAELHAALLARSPRSQLYALLDGTSWLRAHPHTSARVARDCRLFAGPEANEFSDIQPWLVDLAHPLIDFMRPLQRLERMAPVLTWLSTPLDRLALAARLCAQLRVSLPAGRSTVLALWNPHVLHDMMVLMTPRQRDAFLGSPQVQQWSLLLRGQRVVFAHSDWPAT